MVEAAVRPLNKADAFMQDWRALYAHAGEAAFFQSPVWMEAWLAAPSPTVTLYRVEVRRDGVLCLLGVVGLQRRRRPPFVGFREARLHESGDPAYDAVYIEYNDFLIDRAAGGEARLAALDMIFRKLRKADMFVFRNVNPGMARDIDAVARKRGLYPRLLRKQPVYVCDLSAVREKEGAFIEGLSSGLQSKIKRSIRLYRERGDLAFRTAVRPEDRRSAWSRLMKLHEAGWRRRGKTGVFSNKAMTSFHERLAGAAPDSCSLFEVAVGGETIGVLYNFIHGERVLNYQSGFLYEEDNRIVPGYVCHALAAQYYAEAGYAVYDLLAGDADYKRRLGVPVMQLASFAVERPGWRRWGRKAIKSLLPS